MYSFISVPIRRQGPYIYAPTFLFYFLVNKYRSSSLNIAYGYIDTLIYTTPLGACIKCFFFGGGWRGGGAVSCQQPTCLVFFFFFWGGGIDLKLVKVIQLDSLKYRTHIYHFMLLFHPFLNCSAEIWRAKNSGFVTQHQYTNNS